MKKFLRSLIFFLALHPLLLLPPKMSWAEEGAPMAFTLESSELPVGGVFPRIYTCDGRDISPPLSWQNPPSGTASFALICDDPDAPRGTWVHWVIYNIPGSARNLDQGLPPTLQTGTLQGKNDFGRLGYGGPCPPPGKPHRYFFKLYALDKKLELRSGLSKQELLRAMEGHVLGQAELMARYGRN